MPAVVSDPMLAPETSDCASDLTEPTDLLRADEVFWGEVCVVGEPELLALADRLSVSRYT